MYKPKKSPLKKEQEMKRVYLSPWSQTANMLQKTEDLCQQAGIFDVVDKNDKEAIKLHVGELGNPNYVRPFFVKSVVDGVRASGVNPF